MPIRTQPTPEGKEPFERIYRTLPYGDLVDVICIDARYIGRDPEVPSPSSDTQRPADPAAVNDPTRNLLGVAQREWLFAQLKGSTARYRLIANSVMFGQLHAAAGLKANGGGTIINGDQWDGYRAEQNRVLEFLRAEAIDDVIVLTGDIHSAWAIDLSDDPHNPAVYQPAVGSTLAPEPLRAVAVEFVCPGIGSEAGATLGNLIPVAQQVNRHIRYAQGGEERGWTLVDLDASRAQAEWFFALDNTTRNPAMTTGPRWQLQSGTRQLQPGGAASTPRPDAPPPAP
jgi:alkaline phosphatase D